jgi:integrase
LSPACPRAARWNALPKRRSTLKPPTDSSRTEVQDAACPGLWLRISSGGAKTFAVRYWVRGAKEAARVTLGRYPHVSLQTAREEAAQIKEAARKGTDLRYEQRQRNGSPSFDDVTANFFEWRQRQRGHRETKWSHLQETKRRFKVELLPILGPRPIQRITRTEVRRLLQAIEERAPTVARHCYHDLSVLFKWAVEEDLVEPASVPLIGLRRPEKPQARERVLTRAELARVWQNSPEDTAYGVIIRLLILTGQRRGEVTGAEWHEFDFALATWTIAGSETKNRREQTVPLSNLAVDLLSRWTTRSAHERYVFPSRGPGWNHTSFCGFSRSKRRLDERAQVYNWRLHDLRRTVSTSLAELKVEPHVIDAVLNHKSGVIRGVPAVYNRHPYLTEKRLALESWAQVVNEFEQAHA